MPKYITADVHRWALACLWTISWFKVKPEFKIELHPNVIFGYAECRIWLIPNLGLSFSMASDQGPA